MPQQGWIKLVSAEWVRVIDKHRPAIISLWQTGYSSWSRVQPGDLVVLKRDGTYENVVGYGIVTSRMPAPISRVWQRYGVSTGCECEDDLRERVAARMRAHKTDPMIGIILVEYLAFFPERPFKLFQNSDIPAGAFLRNALAEDVCQHLASALALISEIQDLAKGRPCRSGTYRRPTMPPFGCTPGRIPSERLTGGPAP